MIFEVFSPFLFTMLWRVMCENTFRASHWKYHHIGAVEMATVTSVLVQNEVHFSSKICFCLLKKNNLFLFSILPVCMEAPCYLGKGMVG